MFGDTWIQVGVKGDDVGTDACVNIEGVESVGGTHGCCENSDTMCVVVEGC